MVTADDLRRQTSPRRDDHFCLGRLFQPTEILYAAPGREDEIVAALVQAHALTYQWGRPWLPARFDVGEYCRTLLRVSFAAEIRPEPEGRAQALFEAQEAYLRPVYATLLAALAASGELREEAPGVYSLVRPAGAFERLRLAAYFRWSKVRATVRWAKYVITFDDWLDFIVRKARRHTGRGHRPERPRAPHAPALPVAARDPLPAPQGPRPAVKTPFAVFAAVLAAAVLSMAVYAPARPRPGRRRGSQGLAVPARAGRLPRPLVHVGAVARRSGCSSAWA